VSQTLFYALRHDLVGLATAVEAEGALDYIETGVFRTSAICRLKSALDIPRLGEATGDSAMSCSTYLVTLPTHPIEARRIELRSGGVSYAIDQLINPHTISFCPAGAHGKALILHGRAATASDSAISSDLLKRFRKACRMQFTKVKAFYVGTDAHKALLNGTRLTLSTQTPREFDLAP
jgi:hypothetical protein